VYNGGMLLNNTYLHTFPKVFRALTGLDAPEFDALLHDILRTFRKTFRIRAEKNVRSIKISGHRHLNIVI
jgi:hypothetical protein